MARDPDEGGAFVFELVDDDGEDAPSARPGPDAVGDGDDDGVGPDGVTPEEGGLPPHDALGLRLRRLAPVAAVLAVMLGTGFAADGMRDAARIERIREAPGGVVDVSVPVQELWTWDGEVGQADSAEGFGVADLGGVLAFRYGEELIGLDPASGERAWSVPLGEEPECGPVGYPGTVSLATPVLVCLQGAGEAREAIRVGPGGVTSEPRALDSSHDSRYGMARPGPDGTVLRAKRIGPESAIDAGDARCTEATGECSGTVDAGRDLVLRAEDVVTGEERWIVTVPFRATAANQCTPWYGIPWNGWDEALMDEVLAPDAFGAQIGSRIVDLWGCGIWAAVTPGGGLLRADGAPGSGAVVSLANGGYAGQMTSSPSPGSEGAMRTTLFAPDGDVVGEIPGYATVPRTTDDPDAVSLLSHGESGYRLSSYAADGTERWAVAVDDSSSEFLAQVGGTVVASSWMGGVRGFDLATGAERWTWQIGEAPGTEAYGNEYAMQAFTDGTFVLLVLRSEDGTLELASLDAASGQLAWDSLAADDVSLPEDAALLSVGGHLLTVTPTRVIGLG
jgi:outer membrane protein assembly factor BamB